MAVHALLTELGVQGPEALQILGLLLDSKQVSPETVRSAQARLRPTIQPAPPAAENLPPTPTHRTRHIALRFYYDGGRYSGLAQNIGRDADESVERALFAALTKARLVASRDTCGYSRCGRTDRGVSAAGQVVAMRLKSAFGWEASYDEQGEVLVADADLPSNSLDALEVWVPPRQKKNNATVVRQKRQLQEYAYDKILNNLLPNDIRILGWCPVSEDFSYRYFFVQRRLNLDHMRQGLDKMVGQHDFRNFCKMDVEKVYNFERCIYDAEIVVEDPTWQVCYIQIHGQAFLWHQIRCIAAVLFLIGQGLEEPSVIDELLNVDQHPGKPGYELADEQPLVLHDCAYQNLEIGYSVQNLWSLWTQQEQEWENLVLAAARISNNLESVREAAVLVEDLEQFVANRLKERQRKRGIPVAESLITSHGFVDKSVSWKKACAWMQGLDLVPDPQGGQEMAYTPLLDRSRGTTYEEKVAALQNSTKRRQRYEENVKAKRKTKEEDVAFYQHMARQGGSAHA